MSDWELAVNAMARGMIDVKPFIAHRFSLKQCNEAFAMMKDRKTFFNKVMFRNGMNEEINSGLME